MKVSIPSLTDAVERQPAGTRLYLDRATGAIVAVTVEAAGLAADKVNWEDLPAARQAAIQTARAVARDRGRVFVELPDAADVDERSLMREFIGDLELDNPVVAEDLTGAMQRRTSASADASRFRETAARYGLGDTWNAFRADALRQLLLAWCDENGLEVEDALPRASSNDPAC